MAQTRSVEAGVIIPALQSGISAGLAALAVGAGGRLIGLENWQDAALMGAGLVGVGVWTWQIREWTGCLQLEARWMAGGNYPDPEPAPAVVDPLPAVKVHLHSEDDRRIEIIDLPTTPDKLAQLAAAVLEGGTLSEAQWTGSGGLFSRSEFQRLRSEMVRRNLLAWSSPGTPARGVVLTRPGRAAFRYFASMAASGPGKLE